MLTSKFCGTDLQWPRPSVAWSGAWVPSWRLRLGHGNESTRSQPLDPVVSDKGPGLQLCRKEFPQRGKVVKQVKCLLGEKKSTVHVDRHMGRLREKIPVLCPCGSLNHLYGAFLPVFLCLIIMIGLVQFHIWFFQDPSMCADASLSQDGSYQKTSGQNIP